MVSFDGYFCWARRNWRFCEFSKCLFFGGTKFSRQLNLDEFGVGQGERKHPHLTESY